MNGQATIWPESSDKAREAIGAELLRVTGLSDALRAAGYEWVCTGALEGTP